MPIMPLGQPPALHEKRPRVWYPKDKTRMCYSFQALELQGGVIFRLKILNGRRVTA